MVIDFLRLQHGGQWDAKLREFVADHPLHGEKSCTPQLQNMRGTDFMHVAFYMIMRNNKCTQQDLNQCNKHITTNFRKYIFNETT